MGNKALKVGEVVFRDEKSGSRLGNKDIVLMKYRKARGDEGL